MKKLILNLTALALTVAVGNIQAVSMSDLFAGASIIVEDKVFSDWLLEENTVENGESPPIIIGTADTTNIDVIGLGGLLNPGLKYFANGEWFVESTGDTSTSRASQDFIFSFTVSTVDAAPRIKDNSLTIPETGFVINSDSFEFDVRESVSTLDGDLLGVKALDLYAYPDVLSASLNFDPVSSIRVTTSINLHSDDGEKVQLDTFEQRFSQVPEPSALALMGLGLAGIGYRRHRRKVAA